MSRILYLLTLIILISSIAFSVYRDPSDPRIIVDENRYRDPSDQRPLEPTRYVDQLPYSVQIQTINLVKPTLQNIDLNSLNNALIISPKYNSSKINFNLDLNRLRTDLNISGSDSNLSGSGTTNFITKWLSATALTNSIIFESTDGNIGLSTTNPKGKLNITGGDLNISTGRICNDVNCYTLFDLNKQGIGSATPAGANTQVQFNDSGSFGADENFVWDSGSNRLGVGLTNPLFPLDVNNTEDGAVVRLREDAFINKYLGGLYFSGNQYLDSTGLWTATQDGGSADIGINDTYWANDTNCSIILEGSANNIAGNTVSGLTPRAVFQCNGDYGMGNLTGAPDLSGFAYKYKSNGDIFSTHTLTTTGQQSTVESLSIAGADTGAEVGVVLWNPENNVIWIGDADATAPQKIYWGLGAGTHYAFMQEGLLDLGGRGADYDSLGSALIIRDGNFDATISDGGNIQIDLNAGNDSYIYKNGSGRKLGIDTNTPQRTLDVNGSAFIRGDLNVFGNLGGNSPIKILGGAKIILTDINRIIGTQEPTLALINSNQTANNLTSIIFTDTNGVDANHLAELGAKIVTHGIAADFYLATSNSSTSTTIINPVWVNQGDLTADKFTDGDYTSNPTWTVDAATWSAALFYLKNTGADAKIDVNSIKNLSTSYTMWDYNYWTDLTGNDFVSIGTGATHNLNTEEGYDIFTNSGNGQLKFRYHDGIGGNFDVISCSVGIISASTWYRIHIDRTASGDWNFLVNGVSCGTATHSTFTNMLQFWLDFRGTESRIDDVNIGNAIQIGTPVTTNTFEYSPKVYVKADGNTGIGTTSPAAKLDINGNTIARGNILADINNTRDLGSSTSKFANSWVVNAHVGDLILANGVRISEEGDNEFCIYRKSGELSGCTNNGTFVPNYNTPQPACSSKNTGLFWVNKGLTGVADSLQICSKNTFNVYMWRTVGLT